VPRPERPEFVYLDMGNVIVCFDRDRGLRQMAAVCGADLEQVRAAGLDAGMHARLERGEIGWPDYHAWFSRQTGTRSDPARLARAASDIFTLNVAMLPVIAGLERAGCRVGILSNTCVPHWEFLRSCRYAVLPGNFSRIVLSHEVGAVKPEPGIYATAAKLAGVDAERIFFTDDIPAHVDAARAAGWQAEVFTSAAALIDALDRRGLKLGL
jgi:putative hydrolase of the HAD superfamily